jgi:hypothetical protein
VWPPPANTTGWPQTDTYTTNLFRTSSTQATAFFFFFLPIWPRTNASKYCSLIQDRTDLQSSHALQSLNQARTVDNSLVVTFNSTSTVTRLLLTVTRLAHWKDSVSILLVFFWIRSWLRFECNVLQLEQTSKNSLHFRIKKEKVCLIFYCRLSNFSAIWRITGNRAANLDLCLALLFLAVRVILYATSAATRDLRSERPMILTSNAALLANEESLLSLTS